MASNPGRGATGSGGPTKARRPDRYRRLTLSIGRHPSDLIRMAVAAALVLGSRVVAGSRSINPVEAAIASQFQRLPSWLRPGWEILTWTGWWPGIAIAAAVALYLGRVRLSASLALAGATSWLGSPTGTPRP